MCQGLQCFGAIHAKPKLQVTAGQDVQGCPGGGSEVRNFAAEEEKVKGAAPRAVQSYTLRPRSSVHLTVDPTWAPSPAV